MPMARSIRCITARTVLPARRWHTSTEEALDGLVHGELPGPAADTRGRCRLIHRLASAARHSRADVDRHHLLAGVFLLDLLRHTTPYEAQECPRIVDRLLEEVVSAPKLAESASRTISRTLDGEFVWCACHAPAGLSSESHLLVSTVDKHTFKSRLPADSMGTHTWEPMDSRTVGHRRRPCVPPRNPVAVLDRSSARSPLIGHRVHGRRLSPRSGHWSPLVHPPLGG